MVCVRLKSRHRRDRREWATEHMNWRRYEWSNVLSSDESRFSIQPDNRRIFIWRDRGNMNPIEHVWDALGRRVADLTPKLSKNWKELFWKSGTEYPNS
ncbi:transposable element Tcb2 transposase [Trichonephila clavipes]|nr:transposable element Tcb2 transposase [Trichonephila clavipes]